FGDAGLEQDATWPDLASRRRVEDDGEVFGRVREINRQAALNLRSSGRKSAPLFTGRFLPKRQRAGALQDASRNRRRSNSAPASWSAAALRRFPRTHQFADSLIH